MADLPLRRQIASSDRFQLALGSLSCHTSQCGRCPGRVTAYSAALKLAFGHSILDRRADNPCCRLLRLHEAVVNRTRTLDRRYVTPVLARQAWQQPQKPCGA